MKYARLSRYGSARELAWDLMHQEQVGITDREELNNWRKRRSPWYRAALFYAMIALIPVVVFALMFYVAKH